jgi:hypothetical protein
MYKIAFSWYGVVTDRAQSGKAIDKNIGWLEVGRYSNKNFYGNSVMRLLKERILSLGGQISKFCICIHHINHETWFM